MSVEVPALECQYLEAKSSESFEKVGKDVSLWDPLSHYNLLVKNYNNPCCRINNIRLRKVFTCWYLYPLFYFFMTFPLRIVVLISDVGSCGLCILFMFIAVYALYVFLYTLEVVGTVLLALNLSMALLFMVAIIFKIRNSCRVPNMLARCIYAPELLSDSNNDFFVYEREDFLRFEGQYEAVSMILEHHAAGSYKFMAYNSKYLVKSCKWFFAGLIVHLFHCSINIGCVLGKIRL